MNSPQVIVSGPFDNLRSREVRFLEEASKLGPVTILLWSDAAITQHLGRPPGFPLLEREYILKSVRYVSRVTPLIELEDPNSLPRRAVEGVRWWADTENPAIATRRACARSLGIEYCAIGPKALEGFPEPQAAIPTPGRKKVVVTGCYDWLHSGHVRFFEEVSNYGELFVIVGHDANIRLLKGETHPRFPQEERRYMAGSIQFVKQAMISSGSGWLDAAPEIERLRPDLYAVNEDGDKGGKREYCQKHGIEYLVLERTPAPGIAPAHKHGLAGFLERNCHDQNWNPEPAPE